MRVRSAATVSLMIALVSWPLSFSAIADQRDRSRPEPITYADAEILIYLLPVAKQLRSSSMEIGWEEQTSSKLNQNDYYTFWVYNARRKSYGSVTVGYFAVNKHTADVWDADSETLVLTPEIKGVQKILRDAHHIASATIEKYRGRRLGAGR